MKAMDVVEMRKELETLDKELDEAVPFKWITEQYEEHQKQLGNIRVKMYTQQLWRIKDIQELFIKVQDKFNSNLNIGLKSLGCNRLFITPDCV